MKKVVGSEKIIEKATESPLNKTVREA